MADTHALALQRGQARLALGVLHVEPEVNLTEAARIFQSLRAAPWKQRAVAELRGRGLPLPRLRTRPDRLLTETEEQVVRLVQQRCTNREIASAVFLSVKTVEAYLSRIYTKTGCANRVELARAFESGQLQLAGTSRQHCPLWTFRAITHRRRTFLARRFPANWAAWTMTTMAITATHVTAGLNWR